MDGEHSGGIGLIILLIVVLFALRQRWANRLHTRNTVDDLEALEAEIERRRRRKNR